MYTGLKASSRMETLFSEFNNYVCLFSFLDKAFFWLHIEWSSEWSAKWSGEWSAKGRKSAKMMIEQANLLWGGPVSWQTRTMDRHLR